MRTMIERINSFWRNRDLLRLLIRKDLKLKYRRSVLGYVWSVLNPLLTMIVMAVVFSNMFRFDIYNYPVYLFCGQILFNYMSNSTNQAMVAITSNAALLKKTYVPKYIFVVSKITMGMLDLLFSLAALILVMIATKSTFTVYMFLFWIPLIQLYAFCMGLGLFLAALNTFFRDIGFIYNAVITAWLYVTPIFYPINMLPEWLMWCVKHLNPMYFYIGQFRDLVLTGRLPGYGIMLEGIVAALVMFIIGIVVFIRKQDDFVLYV